LASLKYFSNFCTAVTGNEFETKCSISSHII